MARRVAIGIDLGTSNSGVATLVRGRATVLPDERQRATTPSVVSFPPGGILVGHDARARLLNDPSNTVYSSKRLIGRQYNESAVRVAKAAFPYEVVEGHRGMAAIKVRAGVIPLAEISAIVLRRMTQIAARHLGEGQYQAVITVPANFNDAQREFTRAAGRMADLEVLRIVNEPTAAALAFGFDGTQDGLICVYDFGGGTFDVSIVEIKRGVYRVLATAGDPFLGGDDIDVLLAGRLADRFRSETRLDLRHSQVEWQRLLFAAEAAKIRLSKLDITEVVLEGMGFGDGGAADLRMDVSRADLASVAYGLVERSLDLTRRCMQAARLTTSHIDSVVLVGGTTRVPLVAEAVEEFFGKAPLRNVDPMHAVALGAGLHAGILTGAPIQQAQTGTAPRPSGALLLDVLPHTIGIAIAGGGVQPVLLRNSVVPTEERRVFTTWRDGQTDLRLVLLQGDSPRAAECARLGEFKVESLRPARAGEVKVEVLFEVDSNCILSVTAVDLDSRRTVSKRLKISAPDEGDLDRSRERIRAIR